MKPIVSYESITRRKRIEKDGNVYIDYRSKGEKGRIIYIEGGLFLYLPLKFTKFIYNAYMKKVLFVEVGYNEFGLRDILNEIEISECYLPDLEEGDHSIDDLLFNPRDIRMDIRLSKEC